MCCAEAGLKCFIEVIGVKVGFQLGGDSSFQDFGNEGEIGDGPVVVRGVRVKSRFFENGGDGGQF